MHSSQENKRKREKGSIESHWLCGAHTVKYIRKALVLDSFDVQNGIDIAIVMWCQNVQRLMYTKTHTYTWYIYIILLFYKEFFVDISNDIHKRYCLILSRGYLQLATLEKKNVMNICNNVYTIVQYTLVFILWAPKTQISKVIIIFIHEYFCTKKDYWMNQHQFEIERICTDTEYIAHYLCRMHLH